MSTRILSTRTRRAATTAAKEGAKALRESRLVAFPTETVYGVGALASDRSAMRRLRDLKDRPKRPFSVHIGGPKAAERYVEPDVWARRLMSRAWPGPLTLVLPAPDPLPDAALADGNLRGELVSGKWIALRCPSEPTARRMLSAVEGPVVASSANRQGGPSPRNADDVLQALDGDVPLLIDSGPTRYGQDSTIARLAGGELTVLRKGVYDSRYVRRLLRWRLLFVCTGNTCRSPMAAGMAKKLLADRLGCRVGELRGLGIEVRSAGLFAGRGAHATLEAVAAAEEWGADISRHSSRPADRDLIHWADLVFCMTDVHVSEAARIDPATDDRIRRLDGIGDVPDPIGGGPNVYCRTARHIRRALESALKEIC